MLKKERPSARGEINVVFVDNHVIRQLNKKFLDESGTTDVIAFPYDNWTDPSIPIGDIYISFREAQFNARRFDDTVKRELVRLVVHGLLHLLGYDDHKPADRKRMWARQEKLVERLSGR